MENAVGNKNTPNKCDATKRKGSVLSPPDKDKEQKKSKMAGNTEKPEWAADFATKKDIDQLFEKFKKEVINPMKTEVFTRLDKVEKTVKKIQDMNLETTLQYQSDELEEVNSKVSELIKENELLHIRINQLYEIVDYERCDKSDLRSKVTELEDRQRRDNLVIDGITDCDNETTRECVRKTREFFKDTLKVPNSDNIILGRVHRLGKYSETKCRQTIVKFDHYGQRESVWDLGRNLPANSSHKVRENYSKESERARSKLYPIMKAARAKNYYSRLEGHKLIVRSTEKNVNVTVTMDTLDNLPEDLNPEKLFTVSKDGVTCYYTLFSPHSSFYKCEFNEEGLQYNCLEQYYVRNNAKLVEDHVLARKVMGVSDPAVMKQMAKGKFDRLPLDTKQNTLKNGMMLKYGQNERLMNLLKDTSGTVLAESSPFDLTWGTGKRITDPSAFSQNWQGQNLHGKLLGEALHELTRDETWD